MLALIAIVLSVAGGFAALIASFFLVRLLRAKLGQEPDSATWPASAGDPGPQTKI